MAFSNINDTGGYQSHADLQVFDRPPLLEADAAIPHGVEHVALDAASPREAQEMPTPGLQDGAASLPDMAPVADGFQASTATGEDDKILIEAAVEHAAEAAQFETWAMNHDREGNHDKATENYILAAEKLKQAASLCPEGIPDKAVLSRHAGEVLGRVVYLESLSGAPATAPLEQHIGRVELTLGMPQPTLPEHDEDLDEYGIVDESDILVMADSAEAKPQNLKQRAASAAAIAGGAGLLVLHAPLVAVGMAGATAYAATRTDNAGRVARGVGDYGIAAGNQAQSFAEKYRIKDRVNSAVGQVMNEQTKQKVGRSLQGGASAAASGVASVSSSLTSWARQSLSR